MNLILDTHILLWYVNDKNKLSNNMLTTINKADKIFASAITCFELSWLYHHGRIDLPYDYDAWFQQILTNTDLTFININPDILHRAVTLPEHHKDPHDRIIIATALLYNYHVASVDDKFPLYQELNNSLVNE